MSKLSRGPGVIVKVTVGVKAIKAANVAVTQELTEARLAAEEPEDLDLPPVEDDAPEPPQLEDAGDSAAFVEDAPDANLFDLAWKGALPLIFQLPRRFRPPLRYRIDSEFRVHRLYRDRPKNEDLEYAVAEAVAKHLQEHDLHFEKLGDWCQIPAIGTYKQLEALVGRASSTAISVERFESIGNVLTNFAVELPSGDVVTPQVLFTAARKTKRSTRGASLRSASNRSEKMPCGEVWTAKDWEGFEAAQSKATARKESEA